MPDYDSQDLQLALDWPDVGVPTAALRYEAPEDDPPYSESFGQEGAPKAPGAGDVRIRVFRSNGAPAAGAELNLDGETVRADALGVANFRRVRQGEQVVTIYDTELLWTQEHLVVRAGETLEASIEETLGGEIAVEVTSAAGRPLPFARLSFSRGWQHVHWLDSKQEAQRLDWFTDHLGRRRIRNTTPGECIVQAKWADWTGEARLTVRTAQAETVRVVARPPK